MNNPLANRTTSSFPLSIGTGISFESLFEGQTAPYDPTRPIPNKIDLTQYGQILINVSTLFRNLVGAIDKATFLQVSPIMLYHALVQEMTVIDALFSNDGPQGFDVVYYYDLYAKVRAKDGLHNVRIRHSKTDNQLLYDTKLIQTMTHFFKDKNQREVHKTDSVLPYNIVKKALVLTHMAYDLTSYDKFPSLSLLESHTGKLKNRSLWYTKLYPMSGIVMSNIPFNKAILFVFGDNSLIHPWATKSREAILKVAEQAHWTSLTSKDKVKSDMRVYCKDHFLNQEFATYW